MESEFLKSTLGWFLCKLQSESHCCKGWGTKGLSGKFFASGTLSFLYVELMSVSTVTKGCRRCRSPGIREGHKKDITSARLTSDRKSCKLCTKQFNKQIWAHLRGESHGRIMGCIGTLNVSVKENVVLIAPNSVSLSLLSHQRFSLKQLLLYHLSKVGIGHNVSR